MEEQELRLPLGNWLLIWTTLLLIYSSSFVIIRAWAKWQQQWAWADWIFVAGYVSRVQNPHASQC